MHERVTAGDALSVGATMNASVHEHLDAPHIRYRVECRKADGALKWAEEFDNLVTTGGGNDLLTKYFTGSSYTAAWYMGLLNGTPASTDTLSSHSGWTEQTPYSGNRPSISWGSASARSLSATAVSYTINATATITGAFTCTAASGTSGVLYSAGNFAASRGVASGDTLNVTPTMSV